MWTYSAYYNGFQQIPIETFMPYPKTWGKIRIHVIDEMADNRTYGWVALHSAWVCYESIGQFERFGVVWSDGESPTHEVGRLPIGERWRFWWLGKDIWAQGEWTRGMGWTGSSWADRDRPPWLSSGLHKIAKQFECAMTECSQICEKDSRMLLRIHTFT